MEEEVKVSTLPPDRAEEVLAEILVSERVEEIFLDCLFKDGEDTTNHVRAEGIVQTVGFHPERLESYRDEVMMMLHGLPNEFYGGWSFLNACQDEFGRQWTDLHQRMEQLFQLGIALGAVECQMPRELWSALPGGVPYYVVTA